jgi:hypothetical protein
LLLSSPFEKLQLLEKGTPFIDAPNIPKIFQFQNKKTFVTIQAILEGKTI